MPDKLTPPEQFIWDWQNRRLGDFKLALVHLIQRADEFNLERIGMGFPDEVAGYIHYMTVPGWWDDVIRKMEE
jgi:hypothetical protein